MNDYLDFVREPADAAAFEAVAADAPLLRYGGDAQHGGTVVACGDRALHARLVERLRHAA